MYPFLLNLVEPASPRLGILLDHLSSSEHLWTKFGIRSLSIQDPYYRRSNAVGDAPYWRASIWMNLNFLALKSLRRYSLREGPEQRRCQKLYSSLRSNLLNTVQSEFESSGDLWETYDDMDGSGTRGHPFAGWTALIVNIAYELL